MVLIAVVVTLATLRVELDVSELCFPLKAVAMSPTPVIVMPLVAVTVAAATDATLNAELVVKVFCFALSPAEIRVIMSLPPRYRGPVIRALLLHMMLPDTSRDGALTGHEKTAPLLVTPRRSAHCRLNVAFDQPPASAANRSARSAAVCSTS